MANPQAENGHIDIANEIIEALAGIRISGEEMQCLWVIFRKTYGWKKKFDWIALSQFERMTGIKRPNIVRALSKLIDKNIVIKKDNSFNVSYGFQKDYKKWKPLSKKITVIKKDKAIIKKDKKSLSKKIHTKDNSTKDTFTKEPIVFPDWFPLKEWEDFVDMRNKIKAPLTDKAVELAISKLLKFKDAGDNPAEVLNESIMNSYKGLFPLKKGKGGSNSGKHTGLNEKDYSEGIGPDGSF
jgi:phage replication O-like protein O